jgi:hypothetical protein
VFTRGFFLHAQSEDVPYSGDTDRREKQRKGKILHLVIKI